MQMTTIDPESGPRSFEDFVREVEPALRRALVARYGAQTGREATIDALSYGWEHWDRISTMENPAGYLYRVGQTRARRSWPVRHRFPATQRVEMPWVEPALPGALRSMSPKQRQTVVLVHGFGYTHAEVADLLGISRSTVQNHVERGLARLRERLEVHDD